jgi:hypothetical protein
MRLSFGLADENGRIEMGLSMVAWQVYNYVYKYEGLRGLT